MQFQEMSRSWCSKLLWIDHTVTLAGLICSDDAYGNETTIKHKTGGRETKKIYKRSSRFSPLMQTFFSEQLRMLTTVEREVRKQRGTRLNQMTV